MASRLCSPDAAAALLRRCGSDAKALRRAHAQITGTRILGAEENKKNPYLSNLLVQMYGRCGSPRDARAVFDRIPPCTRNRFSWILIISAYVRSRLFEDALDLLSVAIRSRLGPKPDPAAFLPLLSAPVTRVHAKRIHELVNASGLHADPTLGNGLVTMYCKHGTLDDARGAFDGMPRRNVVAWTAMIGANARHGHPAEALSLFKQMLSEESITPTKTTYLVALGACSALGSLEDACAVHDSVTASGFGVDNIVKTAIINMYGNCGSLNYAQSVFESIPQKDTVAWTTMISACVRNSCGKDALKLFFQMNSEGSPPDRVTFLSALDACSSLESPQCSAEIHAHVVAKGFDVDTPIRNAIISMYGKCGCLKKAWMVFSSKKGPVRDLVSWNSMMIACVRNGRHMEAFNTFEKMLLEGEKPDRITFLTVLDTCSGLASLEHGRAVHKHISMSGLELDITLVNALINMYGKCGDLVNAQAVFDKVHRGDVITWTAMVKAYAQNGHYKEALELFQRMEMEGVKPDRIAFLVIVDVCADLASLEKGRAIHKQIMLIGLHSDTALMTSLLNMYGKCGSLREARDVFDEMSQRNAISWTAIIATYAQSGHGKESIQLFRQMCSEGFKPDRITFLSILNACSREGLVDEGWHFFESMCGDFGFTPSVEHYACIIDLLGQTCSLNEAEVLVQNMPIKPNVVTMVSLLGTL